MSGLISKAVNSPKRAVRKLILRKGAKNKLLTGLDEETATTNSDNDFFSSPTNTTSSCSLGSHLALNAVERPDEEDDDHYEYSLAGVSRFDNNNDDCYLSDDGAKKTKKKKGGNKSSIDEVADGNDGGSGYSSDGVIANKKRETRTKLGRSKRGTKPQRVRSDFVKDYKKKGKGDHHEGGYSSDHSKRSASSLGKPPRSLTSLTDRSSEHSGEMKPSKSASKKNYGMDGFTGITRSPGAGDRPPKPRKLRRKTSADGDNLDGSDHSKRSVRSTKSGRKKKKKPSTDDELDRSDHSRTSTASARSTRSTKSGKKSKKNKEKRGGKKLASPKARVSDTSPVFPGMKVEIPSRDINRISLADENANEIKAMLADENNFGGSRSYLSATDFSPEEPKVNEEEAAEAVQRNNEQTVEESPASDKVEGSGGGGGGGGEGQPQSPGGAFNLYTLAKESNQSSLAAEKEEIERRMADIEKLESVLAAESAALQRSKDDLEYQKEIMQLRLEEEQEKNNALRKIVDDFEQQKSNNSEAQVSSNGREPAAEKDVVKDDLRRQVDSLHEENDILRAKLRSVERALEETQKSLQESPNKASKELEEPQYAAPPPAAAASPQSSAETEELEAEITKLKEGNQSMAELILQEREANESKLQSKDETIQFLMGELEKLKLARGVVTPATPANEGGEEGSGWLGSVFTRSPGALNARKKVDASKFKNNF